MEIKFHNYDSNKDLTLVTDKPLVFVYGKNGMGKTTLSRSKDLNPKFVFNEDFIFSNIYNISNTGASQTVTTKENFSGLWIGEDIVKIRKQITDISLLEKNNNDELSALVTKMSSFFQSNGISFNSSEKLNLLKKDDFIINVNEYNETKNLYKSNYEYITNINSRDDFVQQMKYLKQNGVFNMLIGMIKEDELLSELILKEKTNKLDEINSTIEELKNEKKLVEEIEKIYDEKRINGDIKLKIQEWYKIHLVKTECLFCGNTNISDAMNKWKKIFEDNNIVKKNKLITCLNVIINNCDKIIDRKDFSAVDTEVIKIINIIRTTITEKIKMVNLNEFTRLQINEKIDKREILKENSIIDNLVNYSLNQNINNLDFLYNSSLYLSKLKKELMDMSDKMMDEYGDSIADSINEKFNDFGLNKNITISVDKRSIPHKFTYSIKNHGNISELSDGQKHKVALAIFMDYLEKQDLTNKVIVIDDPVVSLDISGYILFKQYLISKLIKNHFQETTNLIILTHDISYLYIQVSNIFQDKGMKNDTVLFKINSESLNQIPLDYIKTDDITLFRKLLDELSNLKELRILKGIFIKVFRIMVDLKLRFNGLSYADDINIDELPFEESIISKIKTYSSFICRIGRSSSISDEDVLKGLEHMKDTAEILGFIDFINNDHLEKIRKMINNKVEDGDVSDLFDIVNSVQTFLETSKNEEMKNYINHTRNSYSRNLIGLGLDDYFN